QEHSRLSRLTQISQRITKVLGQSAPNGSLQVQGKLFDIQFNPDRKDLTIIQKNGDLVLGVQSGKVQTNNVTPQVIQTFEDTNTKIDEILSKTRSVGMEL
ncbi:MAG: hypothetical protein ICV78_25260, partial [Tolypothrix sp. Co-bin9]|nr:hypothetical protein [Tolypothrix sp. Co-bin9]